MKIFLLMCAMLLVLPINILTHDIASKAHAAESRAAKKKREKTIRGIVKAVDPAAKALVIDGKDETIFTAEPELLRKISVNDRVVIRYWESDDKKHAYIIKIEHAKGKTNR